MSNTNLNEVYDRKIADRVANGVAEKHNLNSPQYIGAGDFGVAYDIGNDKVLKVTSDKSEAIENLKLIGKDLNYIAEPYSVQSITSKTTDIPETYTIILEKLKTDHGKIGRQMIRINYVFKDIFGVEFPDVIDHYIYGYDIGVDEESIENYLSKNPEDKKFFYDILHIGEEALRNGIQSMDYLNYNNLGYKKNGDLGFYDVGFGDLYSIPTEKPQEVEIDEDLEYNHVVGDATNGVYRLSERRKAWVDGAKAVEVKKKCKLAGLGNTSAACNQGDISNLTFKSLKEEDDNVSPSIVYIKQLWDGLPERTRNNRLHKHWFNKILNTGELTKKEWTHFHYLLKNGETMYGSGKLTTKNESLNEEDDYNDILINVDEAKKMSQK